MASFRIGQKVHWTSSAGGVTITKNGVVAAIVPQDVPVRDVARRVSPWGASLDRLGSTALSARPQRSYIIRVRRSTYYWPTTSLLTPGWVSPSRVEARKQRPMSERDLLEAFAQAIEKRTFVAMGVDQRADALYLDLCRTLHRKPHEDGVFHFSMRDPDYNP